MSNTVYHASDKDLKGHRVQFGNSPVTKILGQKFRDWLEVKVGEVRSYTPMSQSQGYDIKEIGHSSEGRKYASNYTLEGFDCRWEGCPFDTLNEASEFVMALRTLPIRFIKVVTGYSEGKVRDFESARSSAIWPEATDAELSVDEDSLKLALEGRLPKLMAEFKKDMLSVGFVYRDQ
jgi:hypothetical protein